MLLIQVSKSPDVNNGQTECQDLGINAVKLLPPGYHCSLAWTVMLKLTALNIGVVIFFSLPDITTEMLLKWAIPFIFVFSVQLTVIVQI